MKLGGTTMARLGAEFIVIVVGVLAALWAESALQARQARAEETDLLLRIRDDLRADGAYLEEFVAVQAMSREAAGRVPAILAGTDPMTPADLAVIRLANRPGRGGSCAILSVPRP